MSSSLLVILSFEMFCIFSAACDGKGWGQGSSGEQLVRGCQTCVTEVSRCYKTQGPYSDSQGGFNCGPSTHSDLKCAIPIQLCKPLSHTDSQFDLVILSLTFHYFNSHRNLYSIFIRLKSKKNVFFFIFAKIKQTKNTPKHACNWSLVFSSIQLQRCQNRLAWLVW